MSNNSGGLTLVRPLAWGLALYAPNTFPVPLAESELRDAVIFEYD